MEKVKINEFLRINTQNTYLYGLIIIKMKISEFITILLAPLMKLNE